MRIKIILTLAALFCAASFSTLQAQSTSKKREVGVQFSGLNFNGVTAFNALYRKQKSENVYRRIRATFGNVQFLSRNETNTFSFGGGLAIGREKRRELDRKLEFYRGPEFSVGLGLVNDEFNGRVNVSAGIGYVLGLQHSFNDLWAIHLETTPGISAYFESTENSENDLFSLRASFSNTVTLGLVRKF